MLRRWLLLLHLISLRLETSMVQAKARARRPRGLQSCWRAGEPARVSESPCTRTARMAGSTTTMTTWEAPKSSRAPQNDRCFFGAVQAERVARPDLLAEDLVPRFRCSAAPGHAAAEVGREDGAGQGPERRARRVHLFLFLRFQSHTLRGGWQPKDVMKQQAMPHARNCLNESHPMGS